MDSSFLKRSGALFMDSFLAYFERYSTAISWIRLSENIEYDSSFNSPKIFSLIFGSFAPVVVKYSTAWKRTFQSSSFNSPKNLFLNDFSFTWIFTFYFLQKN